MIKLAQAGELEAQSGRRHISRDYFEGTPGASNELLDQVDVARWASREAANWPVTSRERPLEARFRAAVDNLIDRLQWGRFYDFIVLFATCLFCWPIVVARSIQGI
jgi:hypothetical protein